MKNIQFSIVPNQKPADAAKVKSLIDSLKQAGHKVEVKVEEPAK